MHCERGVQISVSPNAASWSSNMEAYSSAGAGAAAAGTAGTSAGAGADDVPTPAHGAASLPPSLAASENVLETASDVFVPGAGAFAGAGAGAAAL